MATQERAGHSRDRVPMSELLASCVAARTLSTPPPLHSERVERAERDEILHVPVRDEAA
ncbi:hypothetical protein ACPB9E_04605 [Streptomyces exfoliatus]|uniref:hypothetical protein n=1 Tax=Streptomyces exfoliatus TaxID=1905 RepID=UPI003C2B56EA